MPTSVGNQLEDSSPTFNLASRVSVQQQEFAITNELAAYADLVRD
jgi:hypothetical protein